MADEVIQPNTQVSFDRSDLHAAAAKVDATRNPSATEGGLESAGVASDTVDQTQKSESKNVGAQGNGADPLSNTNDAGNGDVIIEQPEGLATEDKTADTQVEFDTETGLPKDADLRQMREWGIGLKNDVDALKPIKETVDSLGGIDRLKMASNLFEAWASPNFDTAAIAEALANSSPQRYQQLLKDGFKQNEALFLESLGLDANQFRIAAKAVLTGEPVTEESIAEAKIPYGIGADDWANMSEDTRAHLMEQAKADKQRTDEAQKVIEERRQEKTKAAQTQWATDIDSGIAGILDNLKIPTDEAGQKLRERIRGNVWAAMSSNDAVAQKFYGALGYFQNNEVDFAMSSLATLKNFAETYAAEEVEYYTKAQRLQSELDALKLDKTKTRIEVRGGDNKEAMSASVAGNNTPESLANMFSKDSLHNRAAEVDRNRR